MARFNMTGFETGALLAEPLVGSSAPTVTGSAAIESSIVRTGTYSLKLTPASGAAGFWQWSAGANFANGTYIRWYYRVTVLPASARAIWGSSTVGLRLDAAGTLSLRDSTGTATSTVALTDTARWYLIEIERVNGANKLFIDGVLQATTTSSVSLWPAVWGANDTVAATYTAYVDDISTDNAARPGSGAVVLLRPTSLNAAGGWVEGDGAGTAGMAAAVSTRPPPGLASASETSATNIESPTNANDNCDMNMTTYAAAGIAPFDTINAVQWIIRHGEDIATGTKTGSGSLVSNPAQGASNAFTFGDDAGAHAGEVGLWKTFAGSVLSNPAVTLDTAPVLRVTKDTGTTRVVCVDFMGIYVDYTPQPMRDIPRARHYPQLLAH